ncbi:signal peptide peptidase SppA [uncultured Rikenella sp.]|uniref:signal peptide peptidase SppA n=1 Tax=uncultured Rikenella sp. TaxID=368003 RepID=UPI0026254E96|nr:signal peptide peptidase SppA [uncultured Rikenella sp.]
MNSFFKTFFASLLAILVSGIFFFLFSLFVFAGLLSVLSSSGSRSQKGKSHLQPHSILHIDLSRPIVDKPVDNALALFDYSALSFRHQTTLLDAVSRIELASQDPRIDGIYLELPMALPTSLATLYELRQALTTFRESGKFIISYADLYSQGSYYLATIGDKIYLNPQGGLAWEGLSANVLFYKGLLDKLGIRVDLIRHGRFKGAGEPLILDRLSDENRQQLTSITHSTWDYLCQEIAQSRELNPDSLQSYADRLAVATPRDALRLRLVDSLLYRDELRDRLNTLSHNTDDPSDDPRLIPLADYHGNPATPTADLLGNPDSDNGIAIVYASGDIVDAGDPNEQIVGNTLAETLGEIRRDPDIHAVVLRVNSPGGSALASEIIWREVRQLRQSEKPVIVSMGDYAASGGYYMSCAADYILAAPTTLTGSIGVFGLVVNLQEGASRHLGITSDGVRTAPGADMGNPFRPLSPAERLYIQNGVDSVYNRFLQVVSEGRSLGLDTVDTLAGGRVWTGLQATEHRLTDATGTLRDAIRLAAQRAGLSDTDYAIRQYPEPEDPTFATLLGSLSGSIVARLGLGSSPSASTGPRLLDRELEHLRPLIPRSGIQASMPFTLEWRY